MDKANLTWREREVLVYLDKGFTRPQAATVLGITSTTLRVHIYNARVKLGATSDQDAIERAAAVGLLEPVQLPDGVPSKWVELTPRELDVMSKLINGFQVRSDWELAAAMVVSLATVRKHLQNIYRKLGIHSRASAALLAAKAFTLAAVSGTVATAQKGAR